MSNPKIKPILPPWAKPGCTVLETWEEEIKSGRLPREHKDEE